MVNDLVFIQFLPLLGAILVFFLPKSKAQLAGIATIVFAALEMIYCFTLANTSFNSLWAPALGVTISFQFDKLTFITLLIINFATIVASVYSLSFKQQPALTPSFYGLVLLTLFGTTGVALANDLIQFYVFWEAMLIPAWILVMNWNEEPARTKYISLKFFIITHIGAVLMLISLLWVYSITGISNMTDLKQQLSSIPPEVMTPLVLMFLMGFIAKLAIFPFHTWLPDAYTSSIMPLTLVLVGVLTNIGVYGLIRFVSFFGAEIVKPLSVLLMSAGVITMFYGGFMALVEKNIKRILAFSSMSQMGYVLFAVSTVLPLGIAGSEFNLFNQVATKLALFICIGAVGIYAGTYEITNLGGLAKKLPYLTVFTIVAVFSLVGAPPAMGFWPEILTFAAGFGTGEYFIAVMAIVASVFSVCYGLRLVRLTFFGLEKESATFFTKPGWTTILPVFICVIIIVLLGIYPGLVYNTIQESLNELGFLIGS